MILGLGNNGYGSESLNSKPEILTLPVVIRYALERNRNLKLSHLDQDSQTALYQDTKRRIKTSGTIELNDQTSEKKREVDLRTQAFSATYDLEVPISAYLDIQLTYNQKQYLNVQEDQLNKEDRLSAQVTMPLFLSGLRAKRVQNLSKKSDQISSREKYQDKLEQTILDVTKQFFDLYLRKKDLEMIQSRYQFQKSLAKIVENKYRLGTFSKIELDRIGLEILRTEYDLQQTLYSIQKMERDFFVFLDIPPKDYVLKSDLENMEIEIPEIDPESIQTIFQKNTGLIQALRNLELSVQERKSVSLVSESVVFSRHEQKEPLLFSRDSRGEESSITFAGIKIPFQDPLSTLTKKDRLGRQIEQQKITIEQLTSQLLDKIENLKTDFSSYEINKKISQKSLQLSKKILDLDTFNYQRKAIPQDKLLESQQRYHQELYNYEKLKITAIQSTLDWERLLGHLKQGGIPSWLTKNM